MTLIPDLSAGNCAPGNSELSPEAWSGDAAPSEREAARQLCESCPVLATCREWAIALMPGTGGPHRDGRRAEPGPDRG
jgi:hypothetical protein